MYARVTQLEIDTTRASVAEALERYRELVLPDLHAQPGFEGCYVLSTTEGKGVVITFWATEEAADARAQIGFYADVLARFVTLFRSPPGRERYEVVLAEAPGATVT